MGTPSARVLRLAFITVLGLVLAPRGGVPAQGGLDPSQDGLVCHVRNGGVHLEWNFAFFAPIEAYVVSRDGEPLTKLPPDATSYLDEAPPAGEHVYVLGAINFTGELLLLARCAVVVPDSGLRCAVDGNDVKLSWQPSPIAVVIHEYRITRNGERIASVPPDVFGYTDRVFEVGGYLYKVFAVTGPDSEFLVGACKAEVTCFGIEADVSNLDVSLSWEHVPLPLIPLPSIFLVSRDGVEIARTESPSYKDTVPAPGRYLYGVDLVYPDTRPPSIVIGRCIVGVPGPLPPPRDLRCAVLSVDPGPIPIPGDPLVPAVASDFIDSDGDGVVDALFPGATVALSWTNPVPYDKIVISRNGAIVATIPGDETRFVDRVPAGGEFTYAVRGISAGVPSPAASCTVEIPPPFIPPPQELTCTLVHLGTDDPSNDPSIPSPVPTVVLRWWNRIEYRELVVLRDGVEIAELPGDAMGYREALPGPGPHVYGVYGVSIDGRRSRTVECKVGGEPVPPVEDLRCAVALPGALDPAIVGPTVVLHWKNPIAYEAVVIGRDGALIARLPGTAETFSEAGVSAGEHVYEVSGVLDGARSRPESCVVTVPGRRDRLYFSRGLIDVPTPVDDVATPAPVPGNRITCLADTSQPIQGWSFGVASDLKVIVPASTGLQGTDTAALNGGSGPAFLVTEILDDKTGVTMAVLIDDSAPFETLPAGNGHSLLHIEYEAGPEGIPGESYAVRYTSRLGSPPVQVLFVVGGFEVVPGTSPGRVTLPGKEFQRGDSNGDGVIDMSDSVHALAWLFLGGEEPGCVEAANMNGGNLINIADPIYLLMYLFDGGSPPPAPFPGCGFGPSPHGCSTPGICPVP